jgi:hypothetical protein
MMTVNELLDTVIADETGDIRVFDDPTKLSFVFANVKTGVVVGHLRINQVRENREKVAQALLKTKRDVLV